MGKRPNVKRLSMKLLEGNTRENLHDLGLRKEFLDITPKVWFRKGKKSKLDLVKI